jgi:hypothetical protein
MGEMEKMNVNDMKSLEEVLNTVHAEDDPCTGTKSWRRKPLLLISVAAGLIFLVEVAVMVLLRYFPKSYMSAMPVLDALILSIVAFPLIYLLFSGTFSRFVATCAQFRKEKEYLVSELVKAHRKIRTLEEGKLGD